MNDADRKALLHGLGLDAEGDTLAPEVESADEGQVVEPLLDLARFQVPVADITHDDVKDLFEGKRLDSSDIADVKRSIDQRFRKGKNRDRAVALNAKANALINEEKARRRGVAPEPTGKVRKKVKANRDAIELAEQLQAAGITVADLQALIASKQQA